MTLLHEVRDLGQSLWLNYLRRAFIETGELREALEEGILGITSTPLIFEKAITGSSDYDDDLLVMLRRGMPVQEIYEELVLDDIQRTADILHPIFEDSDGLDGYVTVELNPSLANDARATVASARHLIKTADRTNVMVEVPATQAGIQAIEDLTSDGVNVNATHIFDLQTYDLVAEAYIRGMERYLDTHSVWRQVPASVASISLSRVDGLVDDMLVEAGHPEKQGKAGVALAKAVYRHFCEKSATPRWQRLAQRGARLQRPKWTRTTPPDFRYQDTLYVDSLIGPDTVCTLSQATLNAFRDHGVVAPTLTSGMEEARAHLATLAELGVDLEATGQILQQESLLAFDRYFKALIQSVKTKRDRLETGWQRIVPSLGPLAERNTKTLNDFCQARIMCRIWAHDHTVWKADPAEISNRLGWLHIIEAMQENVRRLADFRHSVLEDDYTQVVLLGMGGSSLAPEVFGQTFGRLFHLALPARPSLPLIVLDTSDPETILERTRSLNLDRTLFIVSSKSGNTVETLSAFKVFYNQLLESSGPEQAGAHFVAITDPGTELASQANQLGFRYRFLNDPNIGGRYAALSYVGLVPAALVGVDLDLLLDRALGLSCNAHSCNCPMRGGDNLAAQLGTMMGAMARAGRDKLTLFLSPAISAFGDWVEQLVAESTGKEGQGILPVVGLAPGPPDVYGDDRFFVYLRLEGDTVFDEPVERLVEAGQPVVTLQLLDIYDLGGMFFTWEMATAVAAYHLGIQPFDQPDVEAAKRLARQMAEAYRTTGQLPDGHFASLSAASLQDFLAKARPGDYIALQAFVPPTPKNEAALQALQSQLREQTGLATTLGFGPRFLHSTGQLHKGDGSKGFFIQLVSEPSADIPIPVEAGVHDSEISFGVLKRAQALGDAEALRRARRRVIAFDLGQDPAAGLQELMLGS